MRDREVMEGFNMKKEKEEEDEAEDDVKKGELII